MQVGFDTTLDEYIQNVDHLWNNLLSFFNKNGTKKEEQAKKGYALLHNACLSYLRIMGPAEQAKNLPLSDELWFVELKGNDCLKSLLINPGGGFQTLPSGITNNDIDETESGFYVFFYCPLIAKSPDAKSWQLYHSIYALVPFVVSNKDNTKKKVFFTDEVTKFDVVNRTLGGSAVQLPRALIVKQSPTEQDEFELKFDDTFKFRQPPNTTQPTTWTVSIDMLFSYSYFLSNIKEGDIIESVKRVAKFVAFSGPRGKNASFVQDIDIDFDGKPWKVEPFFRPDKITALPQDVILRAYAIGCFTGIITATSEEGPMYIRDYAENEPFYSGASTEFNFGIFPKIAFHPSGISWFHLAFCNPLLDAETKKSFTDDILKGARKHMSTLFSAADTDVAKANPIPKFLYSYSWLTKDIYRDDMINAWPEIQKVASRLFGFESDQDLLESIQRGLEFSQIMTASQSQSDNYTEETPNRTDPEGILDPDLENQLDFEEQSSEGEILKGFKSLSSAPVATTSTAAIVPPLQIPVVIQQQEQEQPQTTTNVPAPSSAKKKPSSTPRKRSASAEGSIRASDLSGDSSKSPADSALTTPMKKQFIDLTKKSDESVAPAPKSPKKKQQMSRRNSAEDIGSFVQASSYGLKFKEIEAKAKAQEEVKKAKAAAKAAAKATTKASAKATGKATAATAIAKKVHINQKQLQFEGFKGFPELPIFDQTNEENDFPPRQKHRQQSLTEFTQIQDKAKEDSDEEEEEEDKEDANNDVDGDDEGETSIGDDERSEVSYMVSNIGDGYVKDFLDGKIIPFLNKNLEKLQSVTTLDVNILAELEKFADEEYRSRLDNDPESDKGNLVPTTRYKSNMKDCVLRYYVLEEKKNQLFTITDRNTQFFEFDEHKNSKVFWIYFYEEATKSWIFLLKDATFSSETKVQSAIQSTTILDPWRTFWILKISHADKSGEVQYIACKALTTVTKKEKTHWNDSLAWLFGFNGEKLANFKQQQLVLETQPGKDKKKRVHFRSGNGPATKSFYTLKQFEDYGFVGLRFDKRNFGNGEERTVVLTVKKGTKSIEYFYRYSIQLRRVDKERAPRKNTNVGDATTDDAKKTKRAGNFKLTVEVTANRVNSRKKKDPAIAWTTLVFRVSVPFSQVDDESKNKKSSESSSVPASFVEAVEKDSKEYSDENVFSPLNDEQSVEYYDETAIDTSVNTSVNTTIDTNSPPESSAASVVDPLPASLPSASNGVTDNVPLPEKTIDDSSKNVFDLIKDEIAKVLDRVKSEHNRTKELVQKFSHTESEPIYVAVKATLAATRQYEDRKILEGIFPALEVVISVEKSEKSMLMVFLDNPIRLLILFYDDESGWNSYWIQPSHEKKNKIADLTNQLNEQKNYQIHHASVLGLPTIGQDANDKNSNQTRAAFWNMMCAIESPNTHPNGTTIQVNKTNYDGSIIDQFTIRKGDNGLVAKVDTWSDKEWDVQKASVVYPTSGVAAPVTLQLDVKNKNNDKRRILFSPTTSILINGISVQNLLYTEPANLKLWQAPDFIKNEPDESRRNSAEPANPPSTNNPPPQNPPIDKTSQPPKGAAKLSRFGQLAKIPSAKIDIPALGFDASATSAASQSSSQPTGPGTTTANPSAAGAVPSAGITGQTGLANPVSTPSAKVSSGHVNVPGGVAPTIQPVQPTQTSSPPLFDFIPLNATQSNPPAAATTPTVASSTDPYDYLFDLITQADELVLEQAKEQDARLAKTQDAGAQAASLVKASPPTSFTGMDIMKYAATDDKSRDSILAVRDEVDYGVPNALSDQRKTTIDKQNFESLTIELYNPALLQSDTATLLSSCFFGVNLVFKDQFCSPNQRKKDNFGRFVTAWKSGEIPPPELLFGNDYYVSDFAHTAFSRNNDYSFSQPVEVSTNYMSNYPQLEKGQPFIVRLIDENTKNDCYVVAVARPFKENEDMLIAEIWVQQNNVFLFIQIDFFRNSLAVDSDDHFLPVDILVMLPINPPRPENVTEVANITPRKLLPTSGNDNESGAVFVTNKCIAIVDSNTERYVEQILRRAKNNRPTVLALTAPTVSKKPALSINTPPIDTLTTLSSSSPMVVNQPVRLTTVPTTPSPSLTVAKEPALYDYLLKLLLVGDVGVGKTSLLRRFGEGIFDPNNVPTIGIDFKIKMIEMNGKRVKLQIWDTGGQERFKTITQSYYRGIHGIIFIYDITNPESFEHIPAWIQQSEKYAPEFVGKILVGNKRDLDEERAINAEEGKGFADHNGIKFFECSAKTSTGVEEAFMTLAGDIYQSGVMRPFGATEATSSQNIVNNSSEPVKFDEPTPSGDNADGTGGLDDLFRDFDSDSDSE